MNTSALAAVQASPRTVARMDAVERTLVCIVAFIVPAFNSHPYVLSSGLFCLPIAAILLMYMWITRGRGFLLPGRSMSTALTFGAWTLVAVVSTIVNPEVDSAVSLVFGYLGPLALLVALCSLRPQRSDYQWVVGALALGLGIRFFLGAQAFYAEWGIPPLSEILEARYSPMRMQGYSDATFGNTGNSAAIIASSLPLLVLSLFLVPMRLPIRIVVLGSIGMLLVNLAITSSRGGAMTVALVLAILALKLRSRWRYVVILALALGAYGFAAQAGEQATERYSAAFEGDVQGDISLKGRADSVVIGMRIMLDHPLGVGPGLSGRYNPFSVAHEFAVQQGSELGVLGMIAVLVFSGLVVVRTIATKVDTRVGLSGPATAFRFGAFSWVFFALTTNILLNSGAAMPWVGLLVLSLGMADAGGGTT